MTREGKCEAFGQFVGLLDNFPFWFNIATPKGRNNGDAAARAIT